MAPKNATLLSFFPDDSIIKKLEKLISLKRTEVLEVNDKKIINLAEI